MAIRDSERVARAMMMCELLGEDEIVSNLEKLDREGQQSLVDIKKDNNMFVKFLREREDRRSDGKRETVRIIRDLAEQQQNNDRRTT